MSTGNGSASTVLLTVWFICAASTLVAEAVTWNGNWAFACDFKGNDLKSEFMSGDQCGGRCYNTQGCTHFTWTTANGGTCWMKTGTVTNTDAIDTGDNSMVCGLLVEKMAPAAPLGVKWRGNNWAFGCDFQGNNLKSENIPGDQCGGRCYNTQGCTHFTWTTANGGTCWMKRGSVSKKDAKPTGDNSMVCGVIHENSDGDSGGGDSGSGGDSGIGAKVSGSTTRYWDCCKPSCSWLGKVPGNKYVQACYRNGYTRTPDANTRSGCDGGAAFSCNNNQPKAVNDQLAYGFAAATIPGLDERGRCCACYKLDFTSGPVQGKSMVVQVTNSGGDVHPNQFDLQIPGGGVGIFNGCSAQWNAGPDGWGQRYGGVSSRNSCNSLPTQIRNGCYWRFDWFKGADNPAMVYSRVRCPDELVAISGCRRDDD